MSKKTKQILSMLISVAMIFSMLAGINLSVSAENDILDYLEWEINNGEVTITHCDRSISGDVVIPDTIDGYPVTAIGEEAFCYCGFKSINIPDSVEAIGPAAFTGCYNLEEIVIPDSVTSTIGNNIFTACVKLKNVTIGNGVTGIESDAFFNCCSLENVKIGKSVTFIERYAFDSDFGCCLKSITIPENVEIVERRAFSGCFALTDITICNPEMTIGEENFVYISNIEFLVDIDEYLSMVKEVCMHLILRDINSTEFDEEAAQASIDKFSSSFNMLEEPQIIADAVIYGHKGSTAEAYANENNLTFAEIGQVTPPVEEEPDVPELPDVPDVPETPENPEENKPENDFFGMIREIFERIVDFFKQIFDVFKSIFA